MGERKRPSLPLRGGCACGAIRYQVGAMPLFLYACHCTDCQRQSGGAFSMGLPVAASAFQIERGQAKAWQFVGGGSERVNLRAPLTTHRDWCHSRTTSCEARSPGNGSPMLPPALQPCRAKPRSYRW
jgi:hypothetical protein